MWYGVRYISDSIMNDVVFFISWIIVCCNMINGFYNVVLIDGNINNDGIWFYLFNYFFCNESWCFGFWDEYGVD